METSKGLVALLKTLKIRTGACRAVKRSLCQSQKERQLLGKRKLLRKKVVKNTKAAEVKNMSKGGVVAKGCGAVMSNRRKRTKGSVVKL